MSAYTPRLRTAIEVLRYEHDMIAWIRAGLCPRAAADLAQLAVDVRRAP